MASASAVFGSSARHGNNSHNKNSSNSYTEPLLAASGADAAQSTRGDHAATPSTARDRWLRATDAVRHNVRTARSQSGMPLLNLGDSNLYDLIRRAQAANAGGSIASSGANGDSSGSGSGSDDDSGSDDNSNSNRGNTAGGGGGGGSGVGYAGAGAGSAGAGSWRKKKGKSPRHAARRPSAKSARLHARALLAARIVTDALEGRPLTLFHAGTPAVKQTLRNLLNSTVYSGFMYLVILLHCAIVEWETPSSTMRNTGKLEVTLATVEAGCLLMYVNAMFLLGCLPLPLM